MMTLRFATIGVLIAAAASPATARAESGDFSISDASLNQAMRQYRQSTSDQVAWYNPFMPEASVSYVAPSHAEGDALADAGPNESADQRLTHIVAQYRRAMLDRSGWQNPYLPSVASGNPLLAAAVGRGLTMPGTVAGQQERRSIAAGPKDSASEEEGAGSGEPEVDGTKPPAK